MGNTPNIRFEGFTDDWEQRKLGDVCEEFQSGKSIKTERIDTDSEYPVYGGNGLRGYSSDYNHDGEFALIGRQGALCGNLNWSSGKAYFTEHAVVVKADKNSNTKFLYYLLDTMNLGQYSDQSAQPGLAVNKLIKLENYIPKLKEQELISEYFSGLDNLITLHQRKCDETKELKKYMLQKMFPKNGEKIPEIRFSGFTDDWEQCKASMIFKSVSDKNHIELPVLSASQELGMVRRDEIGIDIKYDEAGIKNYKRVKPGQFVIHLRSFQGGFAWSDIEGITSPAYTIIDFVQPEKHASSFWKEVLTSSVFIKRLETVTYGIRDGRSISYTDFCTLNFSVPSVAEQERIGLYLSSLDNLITLHQRKCDELKELKKFMLQNMFPQKG